MSFSLCFCWGTRNKSSSRGRLGGGKPYPGRQPRVRTFLCGSSIGYGKSRTRSIQVCDVISCIREQRIIPPITYAVDVALSTYCVVGPLPNTSCFPPPITFPSHAAYILGISRKGPANALCDSGKERLTRNAESNSAGFY
ncbi:hypothetical protein VTK56DRAFT_2769 [Thermocarpiscus australiensis]